MSVSHAHVHAAPQADHQQAAQKHHAEAEPSQHDFRYAYGAEQSGNPLSGNYPPTTLWSRLPFLQRKLEVGSPDDPLEHEADRVADQVLQRMSLDSPLLSGSKIQRQCAECGQDQLIQAKFLPTTSMVSTPGGAGSFLAPRHATQQIQSSIGNGSQLPPRVLSQMESGFGRDLSSIRIHTDQQAASLSRDLKARAFTIGRDIYFGEGQFDPGTRLGQHLLAHELVHTQQQTAGTIRRNPGGTPMTRAAFEVKMKTFGVTKVIDGTIDDQIRLDGIDITKKKELEAIWKPWKPGTSSEIYDQIVASFESFNTTMGGLPNVPELVFLPAHYVYEGGAYKPYSMAGAMWTGSAMAVFESITLLVKGLPENRASATPIDKSNPIPTITPTKIDSPTKAQSAERMIVHELGHALETSVTSGSTPADPTILNDFKNAVGWWDQTTLYDMGQQKVKDAFKTHSTPPPDLYKITKDNWEGHQWVEQPMSDYSVKGGAKEDLAETIMAFIEKPQVLQSRSPLRYNFVANNKTKWGKALKKPTP